MQQIRELQPCCQLCGVALSAMHCCSGTPLWKPKWKHAPMQPPRSSSWGAQKPLAKTAWAVTGESSQPGTLVPEALGICMENSCMWRILDTSRKKTENKDRWGVSVERSILGELSVSTWHQELKGIPMETKQRGKEERKEIWIQISWRHKSLLFHDCHSQKNLTKVCFIQHQPANWWASIQHKK